MPPTAIEHSLAGGGAALCAIVTLHPLDVVKVRFQAQQGGSTPAHRTVYKNTWHALKTIAQTEGTAGLYAGLRVNAIGGVGAWGGYFYLYAQCKRYLQRKSPVLGDKEHMQAALSAGTITAAITNPIWRIKTLMVLQQKTPFPSVRAAIVHVWEKDGVLGFWRGFIPALFGVGHGAVQFVAYERLRAIVKRRQWDNDGTFFLCGALSKLAATVVTYPYQVLRTRLQDMDRSRSSLRQVIRQTWHGEGVRGFYRGLGPGVLRVMPQSAIVFMCYERLLSLVSAHP